MKTLIFGLLFLGLTSLSFAQEKKTANMERVEKLPEVVLEKAGDDFSVYLPDNNPDKKVRYLEDTFIAYRLGKDHKDYGTYLVFFKIKDGALTATYNEKGKLIKTVEKYKNTILPKEVYKAINTAYPNWIITKDRYLYTQKKGKILKKEYKIIIENGNKTRRLTITPNGKIISR